MHFENSAIKFICQFPVFFVTSILLQIYIGLYELVYAWYLFGRLTSVQELWRVSVCVCVYECKHERAQRCVLELSPNAFWLFYSQTNSNALTLVTAFNDQKYGNILYLYICTLLLLLKLVIESISKEHFPILFFLSFDGGGIQSKRKRKRTRRGHDKQCTNSIGTSSIQNRSGTSSTHIS